MRRLVLDKLKKWKDCANRKPLVLKGARQVGKTWLMHEFGKTCFDDYVYLNCENNERLKKQFDVDFDVDRLIKFFEFETNKKIIPGKTLLILDEIQEIPKAITSLKYFCENISELHIIVAGSLLGVFHHSGVSFPVGKVETVNVYPLNFIEFLIAIGQEKYAKLIIDKEHTIISSYKDIYENYLKMYYYVGGMPEVVNDFIINNDYERVRQIQERLINDYENDFSKHADANVATRIREVWHNIVKNLDKENKKFVYGLIRTGARAKDYELAIMWLCDAGFVYKVNRINKIMLPSVSYKDEKVFKLFLFDVGLLTCMTKLKKDILLYNDNVLVEFKGALNENFVLNELLLKEKYFISYYTNERSTSEIDFVIDDGKEIIPVEVKSSINLRSKSLSVVIEKYNIKKAYRFSLADYKKNEVIEDIPIYEI